MIEAKNVSKWFDGQRILYDISANFDTGKTNLIIGQSGSGKTVFMKCLIGLLTPEEGISCMTDVPSNPWVFRNAVLSAWR